MNTWDYMPRAGEGWGSDPYGRGGGKKRRGGVSIRFSLDPLEKY